MRRAVALVTTVLALTLALATTTGAVTQPVGSVSVTPGSGSSLAPGGGYFLLGGQPGAMLDQSVRIENGGSAPVTAVIAGVDATTAAGTGAVYGAPGETVTRVGTWITPDQTRLDLAPHETQTLHFAVHVPASVASGQYLGGLSVGIGVPGSTPATPASSVPPGFGVAITMQTQRVLGVEVDVPGVPFVPSLVVRDVRFATAGIGRVLSVTLANDGNGFARGSGTIAVPSANVNQPIAVGTFVPGTTAEYQVPWPAGVDDAHPTVDVAIDYDGRTLQWSGVVGGAAAAAPRTRPAAHRSGGVRVGVVVLVAGGVALVLGLAFVALGRRRRAEPRRPSSAPTRTVTRRSPRPVQRTRGRG